MEFIRDLKSFLSLGFEVILHSKVERINRWYSKRPCTETCIEQKHVRLIVDIRLAMHIEEKPNLIG
jgi:hypothetical protein